MKFRNWIACEELKDKLIETKGDGRFPETVFAYLSNALNIDTGELEKLPWQECALLLSSALENPYKITIPIITLAPKSKKDSDPEYDGRTFNRYVNILASAYGWSIEYISELEVNQAFGLIQEVLTDEFLDQEFHYSISEIAYQYDKATKKSHYKKLDRPYWMRQTMDSTPKRVRIRKDLLPVGLVQDVSGMPEEFQIIGYEVERKK